MPVTRSRSKKPETEKAVEEKKKETLTHTSDADDVEITFDSSAEEESEASDVEEIKINDIPPPPAHEKSAQDETKPGTVYLSHIPHGFYEKQMEAYFSQFGDIKNLMLARNKKGKSKHYAFIQFKNCEVAKIAADTMDNYLLFGRILKCKVVPEMERKWEKFRNIPWKKIECKKRNRAKTPEEKKKALENAIAREMKLRKKIKAAGIDYEFSGLVKQE